MLYDAQWSSYSWTLESSRLISQLTLNNCCNVCHDQQVEDWAVNQVVYQHLYRKVTHSEYLSSLCVSTVWMSASIHVVRLQP